LSSCDEPDSKSRDGLSLSEYKAFLVENYDEAFNPPTMETMNEATSARFFDEI